MIAFLCARISFWEEIILLVWKKLYFWQDRNFKHIWHKRSLPIIVLVDKKNSSSRITIGLSAFFWSADSLKNEQYTKWKNTHWLFNNNSLKILRWSKCYHCVIKCLSYEPNYSLKEMVSYFLLLVINGKSREDPLEKGMATHSSVLAWRISWTEEPDRLQLHGVT